MAAQITPALFSTLVWIVWLAASPQVLAVLWAAAAALVAARSSRFGLWWRFGARPAARFERDTMLRAIVPLVWLRGRNQPSVWVATRLNGSDVVMLDRRILVVRSGFVAAVAAGRLSEDQASALVAHAQGQQRVRSSVLLAAGEAYCWPGTLAAILAGGLVGRRAARVGLLSFAWRIRWLVLGVATLDNFLNQRWPALVGVVIIGTLSWTTGRFAGRWDSTLLALGDERVIAEGFGLTLAAVIRSHDTSGGNLERISRLTRADGPRGGRRSRAAWPRARTC